MVEMKIVDAPPGVAACSLQPGDVFERVGHPGPCMVLSSKDHMAKAAIRAEEGDAEGCVLFTHLTSKAPIGRFEFELNSMRPDLQVTLLGRVEFTDTRTTA